jgi:hypothetical protein
MSGSPLALEVDSVKTRLKDIRMSGDYDRLSCHIKGTARDLYERLQSCGRSPPRSTGGHVSREDDQTIIVCKGQCISTIRRLL